MKKLLIFIMTATVFLNITAYAYNKDLSLQYASEHFDDGKGLCAEFVADCLRAGGLSIDANDCNSLVETLTEDYGFGIYPLIMEEDGRVSSEKNMDFLSVGDVIAQECHDCGGFFHVVLAGGEHKGFITFYAHNAPHGNTEKDVFYNVPNYEHTGHKAVAYSIHFPEENRNLSYKLYTVEAENGLNMRSAPSTEGMVVTTIDDKTVLSVFPDLSKEDWYYTVFRGKRGYVKKDFLKETVIHKETDISIKVTKESLDASPVIIEGRTLLPVRVIFEALGGQVNWDDSVKTATVSFQDKTITLKHLERVMKADGEEKDLIVPSIIIDGRMYVGARGVSEGLEKTVIWENNTVTIY